MLISTYTKKEFEFIWRLYVYTLVIKSCDLYFFWKIFYQNWIQVHRNS